MNEEMTTKEFLRQYLAANRRIDTKLEQISKLRALAAKSTTVLGDGTSFGGGCTDKISGIIAKIVDMERQVDAQIDELQEIKRDVMAVVDKVADARLQNLLERRYINNQKWEQIAYEMGYDIRWVYRMHGRALYHVQQIRHGKPVS